MRKQLQNWTSPQKKRSLLANPTDQSNFKHSYMRAGQTYFKLYTAIAVIEAKNIKRLEMAFLKLATKWHFMGEEKHKQITRIVCVCVWTVHINNTYFTLFYDLIIKLCKS